MTTILLGFVGPREETTTLYYNGSDQIERVNSIVKYTGGSEFESKYRILWDNDNPIKTQYFQDDELNLEFDFEYDDKLNPFYLNPIFLSNISGNSATLWAKNNVTQSTATDYSGLYDPSCIVCPVEYTYNDQNYPTKIESDFQTVEIDYR